jgi:hypothetical protein
MICDPAEARTRLMKSAICAVLFLAVVLAAAPARSDTYTLQLVARTGVSLHGRTLTAIGPPVLNNDGTVAFWGGHNGFMVDGIYSSGAIFSQDRILVQPGDVVAGQTVRALDIHYSLNDGGTLAFNANGNSILTYNPFNSAANSLVVQKGDVVGGLALSGVTSPSLNNDGDVAFQGYFPLQGSFAPYGSVLFDSSTGQFTMVAKLGDIIDGRTINSLGAPALNDSGDVASIVSFYEGGTRGVLLGDSILATQSGLGAGNVALNNDGDVAVAGTSAIYAYGPNAPATNILAQVGSTIEEQRLFWPFNDPSMNESGTVAFATELLGSDGDALLMDPWHIAYGIFTQNGLVAASGMVVDGATIGGVDSLYRINNLDVAINDSGQIAFVTKFTDSTFGIVLATPVPEAPVPEPGTLLLIGSGVAALVGMKWRTRRS